jgi:hypothetical protein
MLRLFLIKSKKGNPMRFFNAKIHSLAFLMCTALTMQTLAMPPQELSTEHSEPYAIAIFTFFCLTTIFFAVFHKYCNPQPDLPSPEKIITEEELLKQLQSKMNLTGMKNNEEKTY